jgi:hypothetical protein
MRPPFRFLPLLVATTSALALGGCDAALAGVFLPGVGRPITGRVVDARTRLPVGGATVVAGLGSAVTDGQGRFSLFGNFGGREVSVARAGYVAMTRGGLSPDPGEDLAFELEPLFPAEQPTNTRFLTLRGPVSGLPGPTAPAVVFLAGTPASVSNAAYNVEFKGAMPGRILTSVLAWGTLDQPYYEGATASQPFVFQNFKYVIESWPLGDTVPESIREQPLVIPPVSEVPIQTTKVSYGNLDPRFRAVQTDVLLDFGVLGYVPVARASASNQGLQIPTIKDLKYVVTGEARDPSGKYASLVTLTTNNPGEATFQMLAVPSIEGPPATAAGTRPTFAWTPVPGEVNYEVELYEVGEARPKWVGYTDQPEITYPAFVPNDINGAALRPDKKYSWNLRAIDLLEETETPTAARTFGLLGADVAAPIPVRPYRSRKRESMVRDNGFAP